VVYVHQSCIVFKSRRFSRITPVFGTSAGDYTIRISPRFRNQIRVIGLYEGVVNVILGLAVLVKLQLVTDKHKRRQTHGKSM